MNVITVCGLLLLCIAAEFYIIHKLDTRTQDGFDSEYTLIERMERK